MAPGCFACFFGLKGVPLRRDFDDFELDDNNDNDALDAYMRNGKVGARGSLQGPLGHTSKDATASARRQSQAKPKAVDVSDSVFIKHGKETRRDSLMEVIEQDSESVASRRTTPVALSRTTTRPVSTRTSVTGSLCEDPAAQVLSAQRPERARNGISPKVVKPDAKTGTVKTVKRTASKNSVVQKGVKQEDAQASTVKRTASRAAPAKARTAPGKALARQVMQAAESKKNNYIESWLQSQANLSAEMPQREPIGCVREESRSQVSAVSPLSAVSPPKLQRQTISQCSMEPDELYPGRQEVHEQTAALREAQVMLCMNDPDIISRVDRQLSNMNDKEKDEFLAAATKTDDIFREFLASVQ